jgi:uncharacterized membrane protein
MKVTQNTAESSLQPEEAVLRKLSAEGTATEASTAGKSRIIAIDLLRGVVMVIMALDHVRDYFHYEAFHFAPNDLSQTTAAIFFTRFVTHFCAPVFVFLAGTSAFLSGAKMKNKKELSVWLVKRGLWLIFLEVTLVKLAWMFKLDYGTIILVVIWALGVSMLALAAFIHLPFKALLATGALLVACHNAFDQIDMPFLPDALWKILHVPFGIIEAGGITLITGYPVLPWIGVMILGYCLGSMYIPAYPQQLRIKLLFALGVSITTAFVLIRLINWYGDPSPWETQKDIWFTLISFLNTSKYPPSLLYLCMTLGPSLIFLGLAEYARGGWSKPFVLFGRVALFYYLLHLYLIHLLATVAAVSSGFHWSDMVVKGVWINLEPQLASYGFSLPVVYLVWLLILLLLYPICKWYYGYKSTHRQHWWLSYL